jgi:hypothetical protein
MVSPLVEKLFCAHTISKILNLKKCRTGYFTPAIGITSFFTAILFFFANQMTQKSLNLFFKTRAMGLRGISNGFV